MHRFIMEAWENKSLWHHHGNHEGQNLLQSNFNNIDLGDLIGHCTEGRGHTVQGSSYVNSKRKHFPDRAILDPQDSL